MRTLFLSLISLACLQVFAVTPAASPSQSLQQSQLDSFCPKVEGKTLKECCPPEFNVPALKLCTYKHVVSAQDTLVDQSVATSCVNKDSIPGDESAVYTKCCGPGAVLECGQEQVDLYYYPRKIYRNGACTWSECPSGPEYWKTPPPNPNPKGIKVGFDYATQYDRIMNKLKPAPYHKLASVANCTPQPLNSCTPGIPMCDSLTQVSCSNLKSCSDFCKDAVDPAACRVSNGCGSCADTNSCGGGGGGGVPDPGPPDPPGPGGGGPGPKPPGG